MGENETKKINIYQLEIKDKKISTLKKVGGITLIFMIVDLCLYYIAYNDFLFFMYSTFFRISVLLCFIFIVDTAYKYFKYVLIFLILIIFPTILFSIYLYLYQLSSTYFLAISFAYAILLRLIYTKVQNIDIDYIRSAKNLLEIYPNPFDLLSNKFHVVLKQKDKEESKSTDMLTSVFYNIPIWILYTFPIFFANILLAYFSRDGGTTIMAGLALILCLIFIYIGLVSHKNIYIFHEAQKTLNEKAN